MQAFQPWVDRNAGKITDYHEFVVAALNSTAQTLRGKRVDTANSIATEYFKQKQWFGYVKPTIEEHIRQGIQVGVVTASPQFICSGIASALGIEPAASSLLGTQGSLFTGYADTILVSQEKAFFTKRLVNRGSRVVAAYGDTEGDIGMLRFADKAFCINPSDGLRQEALANGWNIVNDPNRPVALV